MNLKKKVAMGVMGTVLFTGLNFINPVYAAQSQDTTVSSTDNEDANSFADHIQKIINDYNAKKTPAANTITKSLDNGPANVSNETQTAASPTITLQGNTANVNAAVPQAGTNVNTPPVEATNYLNDSSTYDFDWKGTPLTQTLYAVAKIANKGIVINSSLSGNVYTSLHGVTCSQVLDYLSRAFNFDWMVDDTNDTIVISTSDLMKQSQVFQVYYADKDKVKEELKSLGIDDKNIYANSENGTVSVTGTPYQLEEAAKRITTIDHPVSQCLVVAQLIEINHGHTLDLGMQYSLPTFSHTGTDDSTSSNLPGNIWEKLTFSATSAASRELSKGKVVARPMVMMLNGQEGTVAFGDKVPVLTTTTTSSSTEVTVDYKDVGTTLKVTPVINQYTSEISLKIDADVSNISSWVTSGQTKAPEITSRHATTSAHLHSGQSFIIGGLMSENELDNLSGIPGLMSLPILGKLFSYHSVSKTYAEVYIMITPYIVTDDIDPKAILRKVSGE